MATKYIHYGHTSFEPNRFQEIKNEIGFAKPEGGFWASPVDAKFGWKDWCKRNNFRKIEEENSFTFTLRDSATVIHIHSDNDLEELPKQKSSSPLSVCLDFETMKEQGVDAIEVHISDDWDLYYKLFPWDCDSILIMNKDIIVSENKNKSMGRREIDADTGGYKAEEKSS